MVEAEYILARNVIKLANVIMTIRNREIKELGLTAEQADSLIFFSQHDGASAVDLKAYLGVAHQTARGIVERMAAKGLVTTHVSERDGRYKTVALTEEGRALCAAMAENGTYTGRTLLQGMGEDEKKQFFSLLTKALQNITTQP